MSVYVLTKDTISPFGIPIKMYLMNRTYNGRIDWTSDPSKAKKFKNLHEAEKLERLIGFITIKNIDYTKHSLAELVDKTLKSL